MKFIHQSTLSLLFLFIVSFSVAQKRTVTTRTSPVVKSSPALKIKPPKLFTFLGVAKDSVVMPVDQAKALIGASLKVVDDKNNPLTVTYYQFLYKRKAMTEDEETGKMTPTTSIASDYFTSTPLPLKWTNIIKAELVAGEELYFFDIVAKDAQGHPFYAPNLKIITK